MSAACLLSTALLSSLLATTPQPAAPKPYSPPLHLAERIVGPALTEGRAYARLAELTDGIGPRLSGSEGAEAAVQWALRTFQADGLKARLEPVKVPRWVRGEERGRILASERFREHPLVLLALGDSPPTPPEGLTAEVVEVSSLEQLASLGDKARGRIVFFNHSMAVPQDYGRFSSLRSRGPSAASKAGAVGALVRSLATASLRTPHTGNTRFEPGVPPIPSASITTEDAELLHRLLAQGPVRVHLTLGCRSLPEVDSANVVAELKGREKPEEIVLLGAHLDSWDVGTGAHDDGAGVAVVLETARLLARLPQAPRRTVRFVLFMNEENGLRGALAYAQAHAAELPRHVSATELDIGGGRPKSIFFRAGPGAEELLRPWLRPLDSLGAPPLTPSEVEPADLIPLGPAAVPLVNVLPDNTHYFDVHHTHADTLDKVNPQDLALLAATTAWLTYALAESPHTLPRPAPKPSPASK